jgi:hypothetical protein
MPGWNYVVNLMLATPLILFPIPPSLILSSLLYVFSPMGFELNLHQESQTGRGQIDSAYPAVCFCKLV